MTFRLRFNSRLPSSGVLSRTPELPNPKILELPPENFEDG